MRHHYSTVFLIANFLTLFSWSAGAQTKIDVSLANQKKQTVYLTYYLNDKTYVKDTIETDDKGTFSLTEKLDQGLYMIVLPSETMKYSEFIVGPEQVFSLHLNVKDPSENRAQNSKENQVLFDYVKFIADLSKRAETYNGIIQRSQKNGNKDSLNFANQQLSLLSSEKSAKDEEIRKNNPDLIFSKLLGISTHPMPPATVTDKTEQFLFYRTHYFDATDWNCEALVRSNGFLGSIDTYLEKLTSNQKDSLILACDYILGLAQRNKEIFKHVLIHLFNKYANTETVCLDAIYVHLADKYYLSGQAYWMSETEESRAQLDKIRESTDKLRGTLCGDPAYNFKLKNINGKPVELNSISASNTLIIFWSVSNSNSKKSMTELAEMKEILTKNNIQTLAIALDADSNAEQEKIKRLGFDFCEILIPDEANQAVLVKKYNVKTPPLIYLLGEDKKILYKQLSVASLKSMYN